MEVMLVVAQGIDRFLQRIAQSVRLAVPRAGRRDLLGRDHPEAGFPDTRIWLDADPGARMASARHAVPVLAGLRLCAKRACAHRRVHRPPALAPPGLARNPRHRHLCHPLLRARDLLLVVFRRGVLPAEREFRRAERARLPLDHQGLPVPRPGAARRGRPVGAAAQARRPFRTAASGRGRRRAGRNRSRLARGRSWNSLAITSRF